MLSDIGKVPPREALQRLRASLYDWHFCDLKKAASPEVDLPRLAFVGLASWIDAVARLYSGKKGDGFGAWRATEWTVDGAPSWHRVPALERLGAARGEAFVIRAERLAELAWEIEVAVL